MPDNTSTPEYRARRAAQARELRKKPEVRARVRAACRKYYWAHREKRLAYGRAWRAKPENLARLKSAQQKQRSKREYRLKFNKYANERNETKRVSQAGRPRPEFCDVCGRNEGGLVFDHCHTHGHFRGWLCRECNWVLGLVDDDPDILRKLTAYLERTAKLVPPQLSLPGI